MKQLERLQQAFADCAPERSLKIERARYYPEAFGNEEAIIRYGSLEMHFLSDRGALYADILLPGQANKFINMSQLMKRFGFKAKSSEPIGNLRDFFRRYESHLLELGDSLAKGVIPPDIVDLIIIQSPGVSCQLKR